MIEAFVQNRSSCVLDLSLLLATLLLHHVASITNSLLLSHSEPLKRSLLIHLLSSIDLTHQSSRSSIVVTMLYCRRHHARRIDSSRILLRYSSRSTYKTIFLKMIDSSFYTLHFRPCIFLEVRSRPRLRIHCYNFLQSSTLQIQLSALLRIVPYPDRQCKIT